MKKNSEPMATLMAFGTLLIVGVSAKHCMKKYTGGGRKHPLRVIFRR